MTYLQLELSLDTFSNFTNCKNLKVSFANSKLGCCSQFQPMKKQNHRKCCKRDAFWDDLSHFLQNMHSYNLLAKIMVLVHPGLSKPIFEILKISKTSIWGPQILELADDFTDFDPLLKLAFFSITIHSSSSFEFSERLLQHP